MGTQSLRECVATKWPDRHLMPLFPLFVGRQGNQFYDFLDQNVIFPKRRTARTLKRLFSSSRMTWYQSLRSLSWLSIGFHSSYFYQSKKEKTESNLSPPFTGTTTTTTMYFDSASHYLTVSPHELSLMVKKSLGASSFFPAPVIMWYVWMRRSMMRCTESSSRKETLTHRPTTIWWRIVRLITHINRLNHLVHQCINSSKHIVSITNCTQTNPNENDDTSDTRGE